MQLIKFTLRCLSAFIILVHIISCNKKDPSTNIFFEPGFIADAGGIMDAYIKPFTGDCGPWIPIDKSEIINVPQPNTDTLKAIIASVADSNTIAIFPNPVTQNFQIRVNSTNNKGDITIFVYDITDRLIFSDKEIMAIGNNNYTVPLDVSASIYFVKVCIGDNCTITKIMKI